MPNDVMDKFKTDNQKWEAVCCNDIAANGVFWYGVTSTGVVCKPSCPSRTPNRKTTLFFERLESAKDAGFRHCKRCQ